MTIEMPGGLQKAFEWLGLEWPQADEDKLFAAGDAWTSYATKLRTVHDNAYKPASTVWTTSTGEATDAFHAWWTANPDTHLPDDADGAEVVGAALQAFGAVTIALKLAYIAQLVILAAEIVQAIATAFITFGASLAEIPAFAAAARVVVKEAVEKAVKEGVQATVKALFERAKTLFVKVAKREVEHGARPSVGHPSAYGTEPLRWLGKTRGDTPAGLSFFGDVPEEKGIRKLALDLRPDPGRFTLDLHGDPDFVSIQHAPGQWSDYTAKEFADFVKHDPKFVAESPSEIRLMACETGQRPDGFAQQFADEMGMPVHAPNELGWSDTTGSAFSSTMEHDAAGNATGWPTVPHDGQFTTFHPRPKTP